jgi:GT2 family glycosyltransferase
VIQQNHPLIKVVIVNYGRAKDTIECIQSVLLNGLNANQIILVDNGSTDDSVKEISHEFPDIDLHLLTQNLGFAGGYNYGIEIAMNSDAERILLLNNDTVLDSGAAQALSISDWDVSVPKIFFYKSPDLIWSAGANWRRFPPMVTMRGYQRKDNQRYNQSVALGSATACVLMVKREVFERAGVFDSDYKNYFEDYDFIYRVRQAGFSVGLVPESKVWHKSSQTLGGNSPEKFWYLGRNCVLFYRKGDRFPAWVLNSFLIWVTGRELVKLNFRGIWNFWRGARDGINWIKRGTSVV